MTTVHMDKNWAGQFSRTKRQRNLLRRIVAAIAFGVVIFLNGCASNPWNVVRQSPTASSSDSGILPASLNLFHDPGPRAEVAGDDLERALELYRQGEHAKAQSQFHRVAYGKQSPARIAEKALFYEGECLRARKRYPDAAGVYSKLIQEFPRGAHHYDALHRMFEIANYWLDSTRAEMNARAEAKSNQWLVMPASFVNFDKTKPLFDLEGHALGLLEKIYLNDIDGPLGEKALFFLGSVHFFRQNYREADHYFYQVVKFHPNGKDAAKALELSIICKQLIPGGPDYDGRKVAEARDLVHQATYAYPELAHQKSDFLQRQLYTINNQQAAKDMQIADFYYRTGHPGSAFFYYEIVRRRYAGTKYAETATKRMEELRVQSEQPPSGLSVMWNNLRFWERPQQAGDGTPPQTQIGQPTPPAQQPGGPEMLPAPRPLSNGGNSGIQPLSWPR